MRQANAFARQLADSDRNPLQTATAAAILAGSLPTLMSSPHMPYSLNLLALGSRVTAKLT
jgi:hypothetical protein